MYQEDRNYTLKEISILHYYGNHGNTIDSNHGSWSHPNEDIKVLKKHRVSDRLYTVLLSMIHTEKTSFNFSHINRKPIVFTVSQIIWNQTKFHLVSNQSKNSVYNLISVMSISLQKENAVGCTGKGKR